MWKKIVTFFNNPIRRYYPNGEEIIDQSPRVSMIWSIPIILGGSVLVIFLLLLFFAFAA
ncbi:MAG: hypothetical protein JWN18_232 [Parcubacteria group bacterium]|nr:hypothetical protein [Parcubacteria group bacterium]